MSESAGIITTVLVILAIVDVVGNSVVCLIIKRNRDMRNPMNYLLVNLAIADIIYAAFISPRVFYQLPFAYHPDGIGGTILCKFVSGGSVAWTGSACSIVTLVVIAIERYYAVMYPHGGKWNLTKRKLIGVMKVRKRVTLMVIAVTAIFGICWGTGQLIYVLLYFISKEIGAILLAIADVMILFNSAVNPFVYALLNQQFREKIKKMICCSLSPRVHPEPQFTDSAENPTHPTHTGGTSSAH
ncbi:hypothetical protein ACROYT_G038825 [Oculina patagonica]